MSSVKNTIENGILEIRLNRPEKLNALNEEVLTILHNLFTEAKTSTQIKGILITGEGRAFCAGADINKLAECDATLGYEFAKRGQAVFNLLANMNKPSIAVVNGFAFGGGCELAIAATMRFASTEAKFGQPEIKLGVIPGYGGTQRLARLIGKGRALDLCLTGRFIDAETAKSFGLVSDVFAAEELENAARKTLSAIISLAPLALAGIIDVIEHGYDLTIEEALNLEALHFAKVCATKDKKEGVAAFLEKRSANFHGE
jgi:enoyl-CoA hydratase